MRPNELSELEEMASEALSDGVVVSEKSDEALDGSSELLAVLVLEVSPSLVLCEVPVSLVLRAGFGVFVVVVEGVFVVLAAALLVDVLLPA